METSEEDAEEVKYNYEEQHASVTSPSERVRDLSKKKRTLPNATQNSSRGTSMT
jgi:hypothetical protein